MIISNDPKLILPQIVVKIIRLTYDFLVNKIGDMIKISEDRKLIELALAEDIGAGDITTQALKLKGKRGKAAVTAKSPGIISGISAFKWAYEFVSPTITFTILKRNGSAVVPGDKILYLNGPLDAILTGERTAMNFLCHLSGVATLTHSMVETIKGYPAKLLDTRKTMPGLRRLEKQAVKDGGGTNHRFGLYDMYLIKENHIAAVGGLESALQLVCTHQKRTKAKIEVEVKNLDELTSALRYKPDYILLDNFPLPLLKKGVRLAKGINPRVILEASGNVAPETIKKIAATGVDRISVGKITHSAPVLDLSLKVVE
jgi:nicotinate-nucleotide pyrophosphorylase (carboxylating)